MAKAKQMSALEGYMFRTNSWARLTKGRVITLDSAAERQEIAQRIDCDLSPENISCDGERSVQEVRAQRAFLFAAREELLRLDPSVKFYE